MANRKKGLFITYKNVNKKFRKKKKGDESMWYLVLAMVIIVLLGAGVIVGVPFLMQWLAKENIFFTTVREGTVKAIMRGDSFDHFVMSFKGYHLNDPRKTKDPKNPKKKWWYEPWLNDKDGRKVKRGEEFVKLPDWEIVYHGKGNKKGFPEDRSDDYYDDRPGLLKKLGLYLVGWPWANSVYVYGFEWNETYTETGKDGSKEKVLPRAEATDFIYVADFTYAIVTEGAETKDRLPTDELTLVTIAVRNPYRALFSGEDWMRRITAAINRHVRNFVANKGYDNLISITKEDSDVPDTSRMWSDEFSKPIKKLSDFLADEDENSSLPTGLRGKYGVEIRTADLQTVELSGSAEEKKKHQEAAAKVYTAKQEAEAITLTGQAKADVIKMTGDKEAEALEARLKVIREHGDEGMLLAQLDAMRDAGGAGARVIWANNPFIPKGGEKS